MPARLDLLCALFAKDCVVTRTMPKPGRLLKCDADSIQSFCMAESCIFCNIVAGRAPASVVHADALTLAFIDLRQFHPGHVLVVPRAHLHDVRDLDDATGAALMATTTRITRAVGASFPNQGMSLWHSIGPGGHQEVPHLHIHVHPRLIDDDFLRVYPGALLRSTQAQRDDYAGRVRAALVAPRVATRADAPGIQRVRHAVHENRLVSMVISEADVIDAIEVRGRGWVVEEDGQIVGVAIGNAQNGNIWALFVDPDYERRGHGRRLQDVMREWLFAQGLERLWLSTDSATRAQGFYAASGWQEVEPLPGGEVLFERFRPADG